MIKGLLILGALLGGLGYTFIWIVKTASPNDRHEYEAYMRWKKRKYDSHYKHGAMCDTEDAWKERKRNGKID